VADFHSADAATKAGEDWGKQFQKDEVPEEAEEVSLRVEEVSGSVDTDFRALLRLDRLLVKCGLAASATDATRKIKQGSVRIDSQVTNDPRVVLTPPPPKKLALRVGKRLRIAVISW